MNPSQMPGQQPQGGAPAGPTPPPSPVRQSAELSVPPRQSSGPVRDIPEEGFGFADEPIATTYPPTTSPQPNPAATIPVAPPPLPAPTASPLPAPAPPIPHFAAVQQQPGTPAPAPIPGDVLPPQQIPTLPTLSPPQSVTATPVNPQTPLNPPATGLPTAPLNPIAAQPIALGAKPFASSPAQAAAPPAPTASYTPPVNHLPEDVAARITETPIQNSKDIAKEIAHGGKGGKLKSLVSFLVFTASIFIAAFLINQFIFQSYYVEGTSMTPTLQNNDRLIISKVERTAAIVSGRPYIPERGQIVVLDSSIVGLNGQHEQLIKRVIGLPGERIRIENGTVTIINNDNPQGIDINKELGLTNLQTTFTDTPIDITVPQGEVYVMGDNRAENGSYDSRSFGPISGDKIQGRLWARILPLEFAQLF